jgi:signal transduction histidine kinase
VSQREIVEGQMKRLSVLIVSDDTDFARTVVARWQIERHVPEITLATSDVGHLASPSSYDLAIIGFLRNDQCRSILSTLCAPPVRPTIYVAEDPDDVSTLQAEHPHLLVLRRQDGWAGSLILLASEALRRVEAIGRAHRAERLALESHNHARLGRYMLDVRPSINNALTSVLGNADLLLLEPEEPGGEAREQIQAIHTMALRLNEIMQRFSSLASEMRMGEKESQPETKLVSHDVATRT